MTTDNWFSDGSGSLWRFVAHTDGARKAKGIENAHCKQMSHNFRRMLDLFPQFDEPITWCAPLWLLTTPDNKASQFQLFVLLFLDLNKPQIKSLLLFQHIYLFITPKLFFFSLDSFLQAFFKEAQAWWIRICPGHCKITAIIELISDSKREGSEEAKSVLREEWGRILADKENCCEQSSPLLHCFQCCIGAWAWHKHTRRQQPSVGWKYLVLGKRKRVLFLCVVVYTSNQMREWHALPTPGHRTHENANGTRISALAEEISLLEISKYPPLLLIPSAFTFFLVCTFWNFAFIFLPPFPPPSSVSFVCSCFSSWAKFCTLQWEGKQGGAFVFFVNPFEKSIFWINLI